MRTSRTLLLTLGLLGACGGPEEAPDLAVDEDPFSSHLATLMVFEFDGELLVNSSYNPNSWIEDQLLFTIGQLNGNNSVGRLDALTLSNVRSTRESGMGAAMPVRVVNLSISCSSQN